MSELGLVAMAAEGVAVPMLVHFVPVVLHMFLHLKPPIFAFVISYMVSYLTLATVVSCIPLWVAANAVPINAAKTINPKLS
jgi:hypothetical protein